jgi:LPXTG-motif cell wall-anchored protein
VLTGDSDHDGRADRGDRVRVVIVVSNSGGRVTLRSVRVVDSLFRRLGSPVTCGTSVLAPGASTSCGSGPVTVRRAQAKAGVLSNQARATARTPSGALVRSAASTATLQVQRPAHKHRHKHKHKHRQHRAKRHHHHQRVHQHRTHVKRVKPPSARLQLSQFVLKVVDVNKNGRLEAGDSVRFGFQVANTGTLSATGLHIVDRRLTRFKVSVVCAATTLGPGAETVCRSGPMVVTRYQAKKRLGQNFAYAAATAGGTSVRSNSTVIPLQRSTTALRRLTRLPNTGSSLTPSQLGLAGMLLMGGVFLLSAGRRRRPVVSRHRSSAPTDPR